MLSAETAAGRFPVEAVETMARIAGYTEDRWVAPPPVKVTGGEYSPVARSLAGVASQVAEELTCRLIVVFTESGSTAQLLSSYHPKAPIAAVTYEDGTYQRLALWWGVVPVRADFTATTDDMIARGETMLKEANLVRSGERVLMLVGQKHAAGATNMLRVHKVS
jgi:pyruvate kinase